MNDLIIANLDKASRLLSEAKTLQETKSIVDIAAAAEVYSRRQQLGEEAIGHAHEIKIYALRKLGEMLKSDPPKNTGASGIGKSGVPPEYPTLADRGLRDRKLSSVAQKLASMSDEQVQSIAKREQSITQVLRKETAEKIRQDVSLPDAKYRVIYADPPWSYRLSMPPGSTEPKDYYPVMVLGDICALPIRDICEPNSVLFLWVTSPILEESFQVINAWGFSYKSSFVWYKVKHNMGHYNSVRHELLLIATRGSGVPEVPTLYNSVITQEPKGHSEKPEIFYEMIETLYPSGKKLEMFARKERNGWDAYGFEATRRTG